MLDYDSCLFQPSLSRHNHLENKKHAYMFSLFAGSSLLLTIGVYDSLDSPNWQFTLSKLLVYPV